MSSKKNNPVATTEYLRSRLNFLPGDLQQYRFGLAYSGGLDSEVLLHQLSCLRNEIGLDLFAVHVHHGLNRDADAWADQCREHCRDLRVPFFLERVDVHNTGAGIEASARAARYQALAKHVTSNRHVLLTAHHQNDQAETLLLHLVRGAGVSGLAAMPTDRSFGDGRLMRPMLALERSALDSYARSHNLEWVEDQSNSDPAIRRSFLRHEVFPRLTGVWPGAVSAIARTADHMAEADHLLGELAQQDIEKCSLPDDGLSLTRLAALSPQRRKNCLRYWIRARNCAVPTTKQLAEVCGLIESPPATTRAEVAWGGCCIRIYRDRVVLGSPVVKPVPAGVLWDLEQGRFAEFGCFRVAVSESVGQGLSRERIGQNMMLRPRAGGERCRLPGRQHSTSLKNLLRESGVAPWERQNLPLAFVGDELAAIGDRWVCEPFVAREGEPSWSIKMTRIA